MERYDCGMVIVTVDTGEAILGGDRSGTGPVSVTGGVR